MSRYPGGNGRRSKGAFEDTVQLTNDRPPTYASRYNGDEPSRYSRAAPTYTSGFYRKGDGLASRRNPKNWSRKCWIILAIAVVVVLILIIVIAVVVSRDNRYPDYSKLNYGLVDTFSGTDFFENFDYFSGYDPSGGFVQ